MEKAILIGVQTYTSHSFEERMEEMKELALACDIEICMSVSQNLEHPHKKYYMNPGKIEEIKRNYWADGFDMYSMQYNEL